MIEVKDKVPENPDCVLNQLKRLISYSKTLTGMETNPLCYPKSSAALLQE